MRRRVVSSRGAVATLALLVALASAAAAQVHTIALAPVTVDRRVTDPAPAIAAFDSLMVQLLAAEGFTVIPPDRYTAIWNQQRRASADFSRGTWSAEHGAEGDEQWKRARSKQ